MKKTIKLSAFLLLFTICLGLSSCSDSDNNPSEHIKEYVELDKSAIELSEDGQSLITPAFSSEIVAKKKFVWSTDRPDVIGIAINSDLSVSITALKSGRATITLEASDKSVSASSEVKVFRNGSETVHILAIGNSFTDNALNAHLYNLAAEDGRKLVIARLTIGGATLEEHMNNATNNSKSYHYWKINQNGQTTSFGGRSIADAVSDEKWDYVSFQQQSERVGKFATIEPYIAGLVGYAKDKSQNPNTEYIMFQSWAFGHNYPESWTDFEKDYGRNQLVMFSAIVDVAHKSSKLVEPTMMIMPFGTAIQNGRTSSFGDNYCPDGYHLNDYGCFTVACTWYEEIFGNVIDNTYKPIQFSQEYVEVAKYAAKYAVANPDGVTEMVDFK